ncbi:tail fiber domain-containing protein [Flavobacteriaceae bacterium]|nr:tail fiber domain-containing protein [Flavobacteriaceae bacterium]
MKKSLTLLALTMACSINAQVQHQYTNNTGSTSASAIGYFTTATADGAFASGRDTEATGDYSQALGYKAKANGDKSFATGHLTIANGVTSTAMGYWTEANGDYSTSTGGGTKANGVYSTAMGHGSYASDYSSLVIGHWNLSGSTVTGSATAANSANTLFVIGNGSQSWSKSDAFKVMANGDTTVSNDLTVGGDIVVSSDARLKANIVSLGSTLAKLLLIDGKSYTMKKNGKQKIGVLAQDIQKVFPELVTTNDKDMLAVNYQGLVPVLINALKEQDDKISRLEKLVEKLISNK